MRKLFIMAAFLSTLTRLFIAADTAPHYKTVQIYDDLRSQALAISADLAWVKKEDEVYAVLMETGYPEAVATLEAEVFPVCRHDVDDEAAEGPAAERFSTCRG